MFNTLPTLHSLRAALFVAACLLFSASAQAADVAIDMRAAAPDSYDHTVGGGAWNDGSASDVVGALVGGDYFCGDIVSFFLRLDVAAAPSVDRQGAQIVLLLGPGSSGASGITFSEIVGVSINDGDVGGAGPNGEDTANQHNHNSAISIYSQELTGPLYDPSTYLQTILRVTALEAGEQVVARVDARLSCQNNASRSGSLSIEFVQALLPKTGTTVRPLNPLVIEMHAAEDVATPTLDISVEKRDTKDLVAVGENVNYIIEVSNSSSTFAAENVKLTDHLDANTSFAEVFSSFPCSHSGGVLTCDLGTLEPMETVSIEVHAKVLSTAPRNKLGGTSCNGGEDLCNRVSVTTTTPQTDYTNDRDTEPTGVGSPAPRGELSIDLSPDLACVNENRKITLFYDVSNTGAGEVADVVVTDTACSPITPVVANGSSSNVGDLDHDNKVDVGEVWSFTCTTFGSAVTHVATATGVDAATALELKSQDSGTFDLCGGDIAIQKSVDKPVINPGETVTFTIKVTNTGSSVLSDVLVEDIDVPSCRWTFASLAVGESKTMTCVVSDLRADMTNVAVASGYDPTGDVVGPKEDDATVVVVTPTAADGTGTPGYWKTHPEAWPVDSITIGGVTYSKATALDLMWANVSKDKTYVLFRSLVSAKLNLLIGNESGCIDGTVAKGDAWMAQYGPVGSGVKAGGKKSPWVSGNQIHKKLDDYNNGRLCAPHRG